MRSEVGILVIRLLVIGYWLLVIGYWFTRVLIGYWLLAIGYWLLSILPLPAQNSSKNNLIDPFTHIESLLAWSWQYT
jgi:hypothetical protein